MRKIIIHLVINTCLLLTSSFVTAQGNIHKQLITAFGQTTVNVSTTFISCSNDNDLGNCATIALIKTAMGQFKSLNNIYKSFSIKKDSFYMKFNDGIEISISKSEIDTASKYSGIMKLDNAAIYDSAMIIFSSICKRVFLNKLIYQEKYLKDKTGYNNTECIKTFRDAIDYVDSGYPTATVGDLLGFTMDDVPLANLQIEPFIIINDHAHAAYCSNGIQDIEGSPFTIKGGRMENPKRSLLGIKTGKITGAYKLKK